MITLTTKAADKVKGILEQEKENLPEGGLRIYVQGGGCSGFQYGWRVRHQEPQCPDDLRLRPVVHPGGVRGIAGGRGEALTRPPRRPCPAASGGVRRGPIG